MSSSSSNSTDQVNSTTSTISNSPPATVATTTTTSSTTTTTSSTTTTTTSTSSPTTTPIKSSTTPSITTTAIKSSTTALIPSTTTNNILYYDSYRADFFTISIGFFFLSFIIIIGFLWLKHMKKKNINNNNGQTVRYMNNPINNSEIPTMTEYDYDLNLTPATNIQIPSRPTLQQTTFDENLNRAEPLNDDSATRRNNNNNILPNTTTEVNNSDILIDFKDGQEKETSFSKNPFS